MKNIKLLIIFIIISAIFVSCKSPDIYDDAVRIKDNNKVKYDTLILPSGQQVLRNNSTLRGKIRGIKYEKYICSEEQTASKLHESGYNHKKEFDGNDTLDIYYNTFVLFSDKKNLNRTEKIPLNDVNLIAKISQAGLDTNILWFETYNEPMNISGVRAIPIDTVIYKKYKEVNVKEEIKPCDCDPIDISLNIHCPCKKGRCTGLSRYFIEAKLGLASYNDLIGVEYYNVLFEEYPKYKNIIYDNYRGKISEVPRTEPFIEVAAGIRFGGIVKTTETYYEEVIDECLKKNVTLQTTQKEIQTCNMHWAAGLSFLYGIPTYIFSYNTDLSKLAANIPDELLNNYQSALMLYVKYNFNEIFCTRPFIYGQLGFPTTDASLNMICQKVNCDSDKCGKVYEKLELDPDLDLGFPTAAGIGIGADIPITCKWDISLDLSFKTFDITENIPNLVIYGQSPYINRQVYLWTLRFGINI